MKSRCTYLQTIVVEELQMKLLKNLKMAPGDLLVAGKFALKASLAGFSDTTAVLAPLACGATITTPLSFP
jgi:hypothetical protein